MCRATAQHCIVLSSILFLSYSPNVFSETASQENVSPANNAHTNTNLCSTNDTAATKHVQPRSFSDDEIENTDISADFTQSSSGGSTSLDGNVIIERHLLRVIADHAHYDKTQELIEVTGNVHIDTERISLDADAGSVSMNETDKQGEFNNVKFFIPNSNMKGKAETIYAGDKASEQQYSILNNASITSCSLSNPDWLITADEINLNHEDEYGSADDVVIRFKGVPFLYTPYMEFPTSDKRRSGLLFPEMGTSSSRGIEFSIPWYWNIAPNHDAIISPRYMEKRGTELGGDYRYLTKSTEGQLQGTFLPNDDLTQEKRYQVRYQQQSRILSNLLFDADLQGISDSEYFNDFANDLGTTSQTHLYRNASLRYNLENWRMRALVQDIQTIDTTTPISDRPYERLPQLTFNGDTKIPNSPIAFTLDAELVDFTHEDDTRVTGDRITLRPGLHLPLSGTAWFIDPAIKFSHTQYNVGTEAGTDREVDNRNLTTSSVDAGLFFERHLKNGYQQTLEPRLYYLHVPYEDQTTAPIFDTSVPEFIVAQLFRDNRFIGGDRIGDTNQLTLALTTRLLNPETGNEFIRASIGQIVYFEDRKVTLDGSVDTARQSDIIAELDANWRRWKSNIDIQWDTVNNVLSKENYFLHYRLDDRHLFNIGYRKRLVDNAIDIEQTDTSFVYAFNRKYSGIARWNYSMKNNQTIDSIIGLSHDSCCWSIQLLAQRRLQNSTVSNVYDNAILLQFVLKGLGNLSGSKARTTLEQSIYGYNNIFQ